MQLFDVSIIIQTFCFGFFRILDIWCSMWSNLFENELFVTRISSCIVFIILVKSTNSDRLTKSFLLLTASPSSLEISIRALKKSLSDALTQLLLPEHIRRDAQFFHKSDVWFSSMHLKKCCYVYLIRKFLLLSIFGSIIIPWLRVRCTLWSIQMVKQF